MIYYTTPEWEKVKESSKTYFSCKSSMYHYYGTANKNYNDYLLEELVRYKKYFYVLRPILACKWIEERKCPPPVLFSELVDGVLEEDMKPLVENLVQVKKQMVEAEKGRRIDELNQYIQEKLQKYKQQINEMKDDRNQDWEPLNRLFREMLD